MTERYIDKAKAFASVIAGMTTIAAAGAADYVSPAIVAGGYLIIAGVDLAISTRDKLKRYADTNLRAQYRRVMAERSGI